MRRVELVAVFACALGMANADIQPDWNKLTDFSTHFTMAVDATELPPDADGLHLPSSYKAHGEMNLDVFGEKAYFKGHESYRSEMGGEGHDSGEFYFDGVSGHVAVKLEGKVPAELQGMQGHIVLEPSCVKIRFPQGMLPPPDMIKAQIEQMEPMVAQQLPMVPQQDATVDGESVHVLGPAPPFVGLRDDATPVGVGLQGPDADGTWSPELKFTSWNQGSSIPDDMTCTEMSAGELLASPVAKRSLRMLDRMMTLARRVQPLQLAFQHLPAKPSLLLEGAAANSRGVQTSAPEMMPTLVLAFAAGTLASLLVFVVLKPRRSHSAVLLENMA